jgi:hypothetical protein
MLTEKAKAKSDFIENKKEELNLYENGEVKWEKR